MSKTDSYKVASYIYNFVLQFDSMDLKESSSTRLVEFVNHLRLYAGNGDVVRHLKGLAAFNATYFSHACLAIESLVEKIVARDYLRGSDEWLEKRLERATPSHRQEACLIAARDEMVYMLGSGAVPLTALIYYQENNLRMVCVDSDLEAVEISRDIVVKRYGRKIMKKGFSFIHADACEFLTEDKNIKAAVIASHCLEKQQILDNVSRQCCDDIRIVIRSPKSLYDCIYEKLDVEKIRGFKVLEIPKGDLFTSPVLNPSIILGKCV